MSLQQNRIQVEFIQHKYTEENLHQNNWKPIKDKILKMGATTEEDEVIPEIQEILNLLLNLKEVQSIHDFFINESIENFFLNDFFLSISKNLISTRTFQKPRVLELTNSILEEIVLLFVRLIPEDHLKMCETFRLILDPTRTYFKINNTDDNHEAPFGYVREHTSDHLQWARSLKEGDELDAIKYDNQQKRSCWSRAVIVNSIENHVKLSFKNETQAYDKWIERTSFDLAQPGTRSHDFDWRLQLQVNDIVDASDTQNIWYNSTILNKRVTQEQDKEIIEFHIGYRVFDPSGDKIDVNGNRFFGWSSKFDEWITATHPRIAKQNSQAKKLYIQPPNTLAEDQIDDSNDLIYLDDQTKQYYAITRSPEYKNIVVVRILNKFGEAGGFDLFLQRLLDKDRWCPIDFVYNFIGAFKNFNPNLFKPFVKEYIPKLINAVLQNILESPDANLRNFSTEKIQSLVSDLNPLLKRVYSILEKNQYLETFQLQVAILTFNSDFLERKLQGLKSLIEIVRNIKLSIFKIIQMPYLIQKIHEINLFDKIFGAKGHHQLIPRAADFLKYLINENILDSQTLDKIWSSTKRGELETKINTYKVFQEISAHLRWEHIEYIINKIKEIEPENFETDEVDLVSELSRYSSRSEQILKITKQFYWDIISQSNRYSQAIVQTAVEKFSELMKSWDLRDSRLEVLINCVDNITNGTAVLSSIKILKKVLDYFPQNNTNNMELENNKANVIEYLCQNKQIISVLTNSLTSFKENLKLKFKELNATNITEQLIEQILQTSEKGTYINHLTERLSILHYIFANSNGKVNLPYELLCELWDNIIFNPLINSERDVMYKWFKEASESRQQFPMSTEHLIRFFQEKMTVQNDSKNITEDGFDCFKTLFCLINEKLGNLKKLNSGNNNNNNNNSNTGVIYQNSYQSQGNTFLSYSYNYEDQYQQQVSDFEYKVMVHPFKLEGEDSIWDLIISTDYNNVVEKAIEFLNKLYFNLDENLEKEIFEIRQQFIQKCAKLLQITLNNKEQYQEQDFNQRILRCLQLIKSILDESEKKGIGRLKSHSALVKGEILSLNIINDSLAYGSDIPKKFEIKLNSNATIHELRIEIAHALKVTWDQVKLTRSYFTKDIKDNDNGKTISDIRLRNAETLTASKRPTPPIPQAQLVLGNGQINPLLLKIFNEWFDTFSTNGQMSPEQCANFIHACTGDHCKADDRRIKDIFSKWDDDKDGFLVRENFINFYTSATLEKKGVVWNNLHAHHYRNDLKKVDEVELEKIDIKILPRYIITTNYEYFHLLFSLLDFGGQVAIETWKVLSRLPTSSHILGDLVRLKGVRNTEKRNWDEILDSTSNYKLLYALYVIEYFMEKDEQDEIPEQNQTEVQVPEEKEDYSIEQICNQNTELSEYYKNWRTDFIIYGGFEHLFHILTQFTRKENSTLNIFDKNILSFILKILKNYLIATFSTKIPHLYTITNFIRLFHINLKFISNYIDNQFKAPQLTQQPSQITYQQSQSRQSFELEEQDSSSLYRQDSGGIQNKNKETQQKQPEKEDRLKYKLSETEEFKALVEKLRGELGQRILATINIKEFSKYIVSLVYDTLTKQQDYEMEDRLIIEYSLCILVGTFLYEKEMIGEFFEGKLNPQKLETSVFVLEGLFCSRSFNIRKYFTNAIYLLLKQSQNELKYIPNQYIIRLLIENIPSQKYDNRKDCQQFFDLLCKLIEETYQNNNRNSEDVQEQLNFEELLDKITLAILEHHSSETRNNTINDKILIGLLNLCEEILQVKPELRLVYGDSGQKNFLINLIRTCLFDISDTQAKLSDYTEDTDDSIIERDYVKCKGKDSRNAAFKVVTTMCQSSPKNIEILIDQGLLPLMECFPQVNTWNYMPGNDTKSLLGYVGLKNLGCICYMNAMLQQFFMTPSFRYAILMANDKKKEELVLKDNKYLVDDNVLHQFQKMFGFLELSDRQDYNPHEFCFAFKDFSGQPVNVSIQQDAQEFLNMIFDKLENGLKQTPFRHILDSVYGGQTCNQIICQGCGTIKNRIENFYNLSVEVRNMKNIDDSFQKFITGEIISDFFCESCNKKVDTNKRCCLSKLPNVLIIHLQRIVFNLDTFQNEKINSRLEFPFELNLEPYTLEGLTWRENEKLKKEKEAEGLSNLEESDKIQSENTTTQEQQQQQQVNGPYAIHPQDYYEYKLAGVVVHIGTAEFGHYYSYINCDRDDPNLKKKEGNNDKWCEFNDSLIRDFNTKNIESECFGGSGSDSIDDWGWGRAGREHSKNAYILVYERKLKEPIRLVLEHEEDKNELSRIFNFEKAKDILVEKLEQNQDISTSEVINTTDKQNDNTLEIDYYQIKKFMPENIYKKVWSDNHKFMFERHLYNDDFFKFIRSINDTIKVPEISHVIYQEFEELPEHDVKIYEKWIRILSKMIFQLLAKAHDNTCIGELSTKLKQLLSLCPQFVLEFFEENILQNSKQTLEMIITCPDRVVRSQVQSITSHAINIMIIYYNIDNLDPDLAKNQNLNSIRNDQKNYCQVIIVKFLELLLEQLPTEVAKNWTKFQQYLEFWRDFANQGEAQISYLFRKDMIAILIDFFLEKKSPLKGFSEKKYSYGNRFTLPAFEPLVQTLWLLFRRVYIPNSTNQAPFTLMRDVQHYTLTENDKICLNCLDFYEKIIKEGYDFLSVGMIIQHLCFDNEAVSNEIAQILIKGLNKANHDDAKTYLEAMSYFLNFQDTYTPRRYEQIFGYPQLYSSSKATSLDHYGAYQKISLDQPVVNYESTLYLEGQTSVLNLILQNKRKWENLCLLCLRQVIILCEINKNIFDYITGLPPPNYLCANFTDWVRPFLENYIEEAKRYYFTGFPREELGKETLKRFEAFEMKLNQKNQIAEKNENSGILKNLYKQYIIGKTIKEDKLQEIILDELVGGELILQSTEVTVYLTESLPTGTSNMAYPTEVISNQQQILNYNIPEDSSCALFLQPLQVGVQKERYNLEQYAQKIIQPITNNLNKVSSTEYVIDKEEEEETKLKPYEANDDSEDLYEDNVTKEDSQQQEQVENNTRVEQQQQQQINEQNPANDQQQQQEDLVSTQVIEEEEEQQQEDNRFKMSYIENIYIRNYTLKNESFQNVTVQFQIIPKTEISQLNFILPVSNFKVQVRPRSIQQILTLSKIDPLIQWGDYEYRCTYSVINETRNYNDDYQYQQQYSYPNQNMNIRTSDFGVSIDDQYKECYSCDAINSPTASKCKSCNFDLTSMQ